MPNQDAIARIKAQIEAHYDHPIRGELLPHKSASKAKKADYAARMARWDAEFDAMTAELRAVKDEIAAASETPERVFPRDIANAQFAARMEIMQQRQLDGVLASCGRKTT